MKENHSSNQIHVPNGQVFDSTDSQQPRSKGIPTPHQQNDAAANSPNPVPSLELQLQQNLEKAQTELAIANDKYIRLYAEFENFRKRTMQERISLIETAGEKLLQQFLPILDDFERALAALRQENVSLTAVEEGVKLIHDKMMRFLEQAGVQPMLLDQGSSFNPEFHEAITKTPATSSALRDKVIDVIEKGYMLKDKVLRYAKVIIGE